MVTNQTVAFSTNHLIIANTDKKKENFEKLVNIFPENSPFLICGDIHFPSTNWETLTSSDELEQKTINLFDEKQLKLAVESIHDPITCLMLRSVETVMSNLKKKKKRNVF